MNKEEEGMSQQNSLVYADYMDKTAINKMRKKLIALRKKKIGIPQNQKISWLETLHLTSPRTIEIANIDSIHEDSKKELAFYNITLKNTETNVPASLEMEETRISI